MALWDLLIRGGSVVDGTGSPARSVDVAVSGGKIAAIGNLQGSAVREINMPITTSMAIMLMARIVPPAR